MNTNRPAYIVQCAIFALLIIGCLACATAKGATSTPTAHACFRADHWGPAPDTIRPCVTLKGNTPEAGALAFKVYDARGTTRYTGFINTPFHRIARVAVVYLGEDGSVQYYVANFNGRHVQGTIGNLED